MITSESRKKISFWTVSNKKYGINNLKVCNLAEFCRTTGLLIGEVRAEIQKNRRANHESCEIDGWIVSWSYVNRVQEIMAAFNIPIYSPIQVLKRPVKKHGLSSRFEGRLCI
jgi:hypothetical protein